MYRRILVPVDGSACATAALEYAAAVAADVGATVHVVHVVDPTPEGDDRLAPDDLAAFDEAGASLLETSVERAERAGAAAVAEACRGEPGPAILEQASERDADLIVVGTHGRSGIRRFFLGSVAEHVLRGADVPVVTVREGTAEAASWPPERVVVATDGSEFARTALEEAVAVAAECDATVSLLSVVDATDPGFDIRPARTRERLETAARDRVDDAAARARDAGAPAVETVVRFGVVFEEIVAFADERDADLVAVGTRGRGGVGRTLLGSVAERIVRGAPVPVVTVSRARSGASAADGDAS
ncbi:universal stress protein [Salinilacihabitans rarus]|uniref:universal stress protein n=1 Tax=Salinilacihabitans rarus TaxID=2961596 RepID=UPI0020C834AE|nr:universal stress protein [Salinilacihabitans rarus]